MKHFRLYLTALVAAFMAACSSMEVDDDELYTGNFPKDFVDSVYAKLHPELRTIQIRTFVSTHNDSLKEAMESDAFSEMVSKDTTAFYGDTAKLHEIFVSPLALHFSADDWEDIWTPVVSEEDSCVTQRTYRIVNLILEKTDTAKIYVDSITFSDKGLMEIIYGKANDATTAVSKKYVVGGDSIVLMGQGNVYDSTETCTPVQHVTPGAFTLLQKGQLAFYNLYDTEDDLAKLAKAPLDLEAIAYQFVVYGRLHGWVYRPCKSNEKKNPVRPVLSPEETTSKLYCDDNGVAREIK